MARQQSHKRKGGKHGGKGAQNPDKNGKVQASDTVSDGFITAARCAVYSYECFPRPWLGCAL